MSNNQHSQSQIQEPDFRRMAIASLTLGVLVYAQIIIFMFLDIINWDTRLFNTKVSMGIAYIDALVCVAGATLGVIGINSTKRYYAIAGIIICIIPIIGIISLIVFIAKNTTFT